MRIKIISKTEAGIKAIRTHVNETLKAGKMKRALLKKTGYNQELSSENPLVLTIWATPGSMFSLAKTNHIQEEIDETMKINGATRDIDYYYYEVEQ